MFKVEGTVAAVHLANEGLSSMSIQLDDNPRNVVILNGPRELIAKLAALSKATITVEEKK